MIEYFGSVNCPCFFTYYLSSLKKLFFYNLNEYYYFVSKIPHDYQVVSMEICRSNYNC